MPNMSYCRFENTANDFNECLEILRKMKQAEVDALSESELSSAKELIGVALSFLEELEDDVGQEKNVAYGSHKHNYFSDIFHQINDDLLERRLACENCGEMFIPSYVGQTLCSKPEEGCMKGIPLEDADLYKEFGPPRN